VRRISGKRPLNLTVAEAAAAVAAHDRIQAISDEIRARYGLAPIPEGTWMAGWREKAKGKPRSKRTKAAPAELEVPDPPTERGRTTIEAELATAEAAVGELSNELRRLYGVRV
jgi:hypothetical protein